MKRLLAGICLISSVAAISVMADNGITISAAEAKELFGKPNVVFVSGDNIDVYKAQGHVEGAMDMDAHHLHHSDITGHMHCTPLYMCAEEAEKFIGSKGIDNNTMVIGYDDYKGPNGSGVWHFFKSYGHEKVRYVDGGLAQLKAAGVPVVKTDEPKVVEKKYKIDKSKIRYDMIATKFDVLEAVHEIEASKSNSKDAKYAIIDTRRFEEIIGVSKIDNVARGGHIPGSTLLEWVNFSDKDKKMSFIDKDAMQKLLDSRGITKDKTVYTYCHVGTGRSSYIASILEILGYKNVKVYTGSWDEWGNDFNMPIRR